MRVLVVGTPAERHKLRLELPVSVVVAGEFATLSEARAAGIAADAILLPPARRPMLDTGASAGESLSAREQQVLELLAEGLPNKAIAARLGISDQTVKFHVASIAAKLGAANRTEAVRLALRRGLLAL